MKKRDLYAYAGKILRVDLNSKRFSFESTARYAKEWIGGSSIAWRILYDEIKRWVSPYEPSSKLIFSAGPLVGTLAPGASRVSCDSINAMTNGVGSSNVDSFFGGQLKCAGIDHIIIQGMSHTPVYLWIDDDKIELKDASHLWGKTTWETVDSIRDELGDHDEVFTLSIGPAGENLVRGASIIQHKGRAMGRCGLGSIMGSKKLKAIAVRGTGAVEVADPDRFMESVLKMRKRFPNSPNSQLYNKLGPPGILYGKQANCGFPYKNFQHYQIPEELLELLDMEKFNEKYQVRMQGYPACPMPCSRQYRLTDGKYAGLETESFWFEQMANFSGKMAVWDPTFQAKFNAYCNQMGLDVDLPSGTIAWAMECYEKGILTEDDMDGLKVNWGDADVILELARKISYREGFGNILAEGCARAAEVMGRGSEYYAMHMKGQDLYEPMSSAIGWALGSCVSTRGGGHTTGSPLCETFAAIDPDKAFEVMGVRTANEPLSYDGKAKMVTYFEGLLRLNNAMGVCHFATIWLDISLLGFPEMAELYSAATGWETSEEDLMRTMKRTLHLEKAFNLLRTNLGREDDYPPPRVLTEPISSGKFKGFHPSQEKWSTLLDEYYELNGWEKKTGFPTRRCLEELNLNEVAEHLVKHGKMGTEIL